MLYGEEHCHHGRYCSQWRCNASWDNLSNHSEYFLIVPYRLNHVTLNEPAASLCVFLFSVFHPVRSGRVFFQRDKLQASFAIQPRCIKCMFTCCREKPSTAKQNQQRYCLWAAIWWVSLRSSLREPFSLRWSNFVQKWTSPLSPLCSSDPAPSPASEITQCITGPARRPGAGMATWTSQVDLNNLCHVFSATPSCQKAHPYLSSPAPCLQMWLNLLRLC